MPQLEDIGIYLKGVWMLVLGKPEGFDWLDLSAAGVWRSFAAILWCLPAMAVSWSAWRMFYLINMPEGTTAGLAFIAKLFIVDVATWILPILLIVVLARPLGYGQALGAIIVVTNWLSIPTFYGMAVPAAIRLVIPDSDGLTGMLSLMALVAIIIAIFRVLKVITGGDQTLLAATLSALFILPSLMIGEAMQRSFGLLPI
ncbi:hypothetical protein ASG25_06380 [Rhizobium sp. Leaf384]|uniref:hypothetical protein n=1 Tax=unclassified Rhizobium TaxID=2613769 RepID=UPI00071531B3|nr:MULTISPECIES: hypothetical protein [unclassified Rhizobium]KQS81120.1 hypothetical protein ASG25_06380 [Rhizobium sp. Leaf384]KQS87028.1 hypothetical protein ASG58_01945 [Rhizobium sp. Leaf383]